MKNVRIQLQIIAVVHVGDDVTEGYPPDRACDAFLDTTLVRVAHLGPLVPARDVAPGGIVNIMANIAPVIAERLRHALREKGL